MDDQTRAKYEALSQDIRADLKEWESSWANSHANKKPGREDIKQNGEIAAKYKEYNKVRDILSGKAPIPTEHDRRQKRKSEQLPIETPVKRQRPTETPSKAMRDPDAELMSTPAISRKLFSPAAAKSIGPTPQRDGRVLGLFDLMVEKELGLSPKKSSLDGATPSKGLPRFSVTTPSKRSASSGFESAVKLGRTPMSSGKRQMLDSFLTPLKKRSANTTGARTPSSVSKLQFDTPAFLKRHTLPTMQETDTFEAPISSLRLPRKSMVRGLSEIITSLRRVEESSLEEDLEALREAELEEMGGAPMPSSKPQVSPTKESDILVEDSQVRQLPLGGFDDEGLYDSPVEDAANPHGQSHRVFKKKGQKRTTRRVNMRPTRTKRPMESGHEIGDDNEDDDIVQETQLQRDEAGLEAAADMSGSDFGSEEDETQEKDVKQLKRAKLSKEKPLKPLKKAVRKVNELAHANFKRLKLRNSGPKGGAGVNSRFRRRR